MVLLWFIAVAGSWLLTQLGVDGVSGPFELHSPLGLIPMAALVTLAVREYGLRTRFGRAVVIVFTGSLLWGVGDLLYTIRASCSGWQHIGCGPLSPDPPYPSWSDIGYLLGPALWAAAIILLWRSIGIGWREL
ncbi:MAG: hypothetical protein ABI200_02435, partial [Gaiellales bacterium]